MATVQSYTKAGVDAKFAARSANVLPHNGGGTPDLAAFPDAKTGDVIERSSDGARWRVLAGVLNPIEGRAVSVNGKTGAVTLNASDVGAAPTSHKHTIADVTDFKGDSKPTPDTYAKRNNAGQLDVADPTTNAHAATKKYVDDTVTSKTTWNAIQNKPATFPPSPHKHTIADITDLTVARNADVNTVPVRGDDGTIRAADPKDIADVATKKYVDETSGSNATWTAIQGKPDTFPPSAHTHALKDITNMPEVTEQNVFNSVVKRTAAGRIKISSPAEFNEATTKQYVDDLVVRNRLKTSNTWTVGDADAVPMRDADGQFEVGDPTADNHVATKKYVDTKSASAESIAWDKVTGKPDTYPPSSHKHTVSDVTGLVLAIQKQRNTVALRDDNGRFKVGDPSEADDVVNKNYVDTKPWNSFPGAPSTRPGSTDRSQRAYRVWQFESDGRALYNDTPTQTTEVVNKKYVDNLVNNYRTSWTNISDKPSTFPPSVHKHTIADITDLTVDSGNKAGTVPLRDSQGRFQVANPSGTMDVANKTYVDSKTWNISSINGIGGYTDTITNTTPPDHVLRTLSTGQFLVSTSSITQSNSITNKYYVDTTASSAAEAAKPWVGSLSEYNALSSKDPNKIYIIR